MPFFPGGDRVTNSIGTCCDRLKVDAKRLIESWRVEYNVSRLHMALANLTPAHYAAGTMTSILAIGGIAAEN